MERVVVIGAGIGGLTLYHALQRHGIQADLYEATPTFREVGTGIVLPSNAMQVLARLGMAEAVLAQGCRLNQFQFQDVDGEVLQDMNLSPYEKRYGYGSVAIHRAALHRVLTRGIDQHRLHLGKTCDHIVVGADLVEVVFSDGTNRRARVVVAADGVHSAVRQQLFPAQRIRYAGEVAYRSVVPFELPPGLKHGAWEIWGDGCRFGFLGVDAKQVYWFAGVVGPAGASDTPDAVAAMLRRRAADFPEPVPQLLAATPPDAIVRNDLYDVSLQAWHFGRVALLGDAAHAMTPNLGQGAAQAMEDAFVLADALHREPTPQAAFQRYQSVRYAKASDTLRSSWMLGKLAQARGPIRRTARNYLLKATPDVVTRWQTHRLFRLSF